MQRPNVERKLMAIMVADVAAYSRLMGADEAGTLARLRAHRVETVDPAIAAGKGHIIKTTGDGMLVEFASVVDALACGVEIQRRMARRNQDVPGDLRIQFRIGINLGDVIVEDNDIFGDGVNVAARLQELAEPGSICIAGSVHDQIGNKLELVFEDMGERPLKNIARPVRAYRVRPEGVSAPAAAPAPASGPDKPSIAVLPFVNMSGDAEQEFFADGLTEDILTELSRFRELFVISRTSAFAYKGKAMNVPEVARELGVGYVVEGSVRKAGNRVRVTAQLIDAETNRHIWANRYDRELQDIFAIQDEVTSAIVSTLPGRIEAAAQDRARRKHTDNMAAYECVLAGKVLHHRSKAEANAEAQRFLDRAIALDPKYAHAHAWKACVLGQAWVYGWCAERDKAWAGVLEELQAALSLDEDDSDVHRILAAVNITHGDHDKATYHQERALALNPNDDLIVVQQGELLTWLGQPAEGADWIRKAMRLNPYHPERFRSHLGRALYVARQYRDAADAFKRMTNPDHTHFAFLAACHAQAGEAEAAKAAADETLKRQPHFSAGAYLATLHYKHAADRAHHREGLLKAGLPA